MSRYTENAGPPIGIGDVLVTREGNKFISGFIRLGARIAGLPSYVNHAIIVHHTDDEGTTWGIEGKPGGVGWRDLTGPLSWTLTNANNGQPKTEDQRYLIATAAESLFATPYDWSAIRDHTRAALRFWDKSAAFREWGESERPGHVVCSSFADWAYEQVGLANPGGYAQTRMTSPAHWDEFMMKEGWK